MKAEDLIKVLEKNPKALIAFKDYDDENHIVTELEIKENVFFGHDKTAKGLIILKP